MVPLSVVNGLDAHKKGARRANVGARESIRYLDKVLREGMRGIAIQGPDESADLPSALEGEIDVESPLNSGTDAARLLSCCLYLQHKAGGRMDLTTLLTTDRNLLDAVRVCVMLFAADWCELNNMAATWLRTSLAPLVA